MKAEDKMKSPKLMKYIIDEIHNCGVIGEEQSTIALTLKIMLRLVNNAHPTSSNVLVSDNTGGGKDFITKNLCDILCEKDISYIHRTNLSPKVLNYWQPTDKATNKPTTWDGKVLYLEDPPEELIQSQAFKVMASGGTAITVLKDQKVIDREIDGKPVMIVTSMKTQIDDEGQRRWDAIRIDTSPEVSKGVVDMVFASATGQPITPPDNSFRSLLKTLRSYDVVIPWAVVLRKYVENPDTVDRTQVNKLLDYIKASAILHQYQRKVDDEGRLLATEEDYELARCAFISLKDKEGNALNRKEETLLYYLIKQGKPRKISEIITDLEGVSKTWLYDNKETMVDKGVIKSITQFDALLNKEVEHLAATTAKKVLKKDFPRARDIFSISGYLIDGTLYREVNKERSQNKLRPIFKEVL